MNTIYLMTLMLAVMVVLAFIVQPARPDNVTTYAKGFQVQHIGKEWRI